MSQAIISYMFIVISGGILIKSRFVSSIDIMITSPDISIGGWMDSDFDSREWHTNSSPPLGKSPYPDAIVVPNTVRGMSLVCNASYPVEWRFHRERWGGRRRLQYALRTTRISDELLNVVRFSSELSFFSFESNSLTGNYTCQKVGYPGLSQSLYVFWEGGSPPYLTLARSFRKPPRVPFRQNDSMSFTLPCTVSTPSMVPQLAKEMSTTEEVIQQNKSVQYDPRRGFTLTNLKYPYGRYTCSVVDAEDGDGDAITFNVVDDDDGPKPEFNDTIRHGAFYSINSTSRELTCCSAGQEPPKLKLVECDHPTICAIAKHTLHTMESAKKRKSSCSIIPLRALRAGIFRCVGAGIDAVREFFYPMPDSLRFGPPPPPKKGGSGKGLRWGGKRKSDSQIDSSSGDNATTATAPPAPQNVEDPYFDWNEADETKMMLVTKLNGPLYVGQNKTFSCRVSHYYYAQGLVWGVTYTNQSEVYLNGREPEVRQHGPLGGIRHFEIIFGRNQQLLDFFITEDLQSVTCLAPIWNSTEWGKKSIHFVVKQPTAPVLLGKLNKEYTWYLNDTKKSLDCQFTGEPAPNVVWQKGNETVTMNVNTTNETSVVSFPRVTLDMEGVFQCVISNEAGTTTKTFRITVLHATSTTVSAVLVLSIVGFVIVSIIATLMFQYLKSQNTVINRLTNLAFKDVHANGNGTDASTVPNASMGISTVTHARDSVSVESNGVVLPPLTFSSPLPHHSGSPSPAPTTAVTTPSPEPSGVYNANLENDQYASNSFAFGFSNSKSSTLEVRRSSSPTPPPLSSFSSYHKF